MTTYVPKTEQFSIQKTVLDATWDYPAYALWWEPGVGKTKAFIDNGGVLFCEGAIDNMLMVAPNGLHRNFIARELPKHLPDDIAEKCKALFWRTDRAATKWHQEEARSLLAHKDGMRVLGMSYDGLMTEPGRKLAWEFLQSGKTLYGADESQRIKEPKAARTERVMKSGPHAAFRRILTGTPVANAPWDVWTQIKFLQSDFWRPHGLDSIEAMKAAFGEWEQTARRVDISVVAKRTNSLRGYYRINNVPECLQTKFIARNGVGLQLVPTIKTTERGSPIYKNLDQLRTMLEPIRSRVRKSEVLDLPPKLYTSMEFEMSPAQKRAYESMSKLGFVALENGDTMSANLALTVMLRLQQIACGYIVADLAPDDESEEPRVLPITPNPRMDILLELTEDLPHQALIWARFRSDITAICAALKKQGKTFARYDGVISDDECAENEERFHRGDAQYFVSNQGKGGEGLTLVEAQTEIYYSNSFKLLERLQSEDRPYRFGQTHPVNIIDLIARGTIDEDLVQNLLDKFDVACAVTGDGWRPWLRTGNRLI